MPLHRVTLERQLGLAKARLEKLTGNLKAAGTLKPASTEEKSLRRDPLWREARAEVRKITNRLNRVGDKEALAAEVLARKSAKEAGEGDDE